MFNMHKDVKYRMYIILVFVVLMKIPYIDGIECFMCTNIHSLSECHTTSVCSADQYCHTSSSGLGSNRMFNLGCKKLQQCSNNSAIGFVPSIVGRDTVGHSSNCNNCCSTSYCNKNLCNQETEVHVNWSPWSNWGSCTVTCGVGLSRRDRSCPGQSEKLCVGDAREDRICLLHGCNDGNWSTWSSWRACTATCNGGMKVKTRTCDNPTPSPLGRSCVGNSEVAEVCNVQACSAAFVFFTLTTPTRKLIDGRPLFQHTLANAGGGYNATSAQFTCPVAGLYQFSLSFLATNGSTYCFFIKNSQRMAYVDTDSKGDWNPAHSTIFIELFVGDVFDVGHCYNWNHVDLGSSGIFTGALIQPNVNAFL